MLVGRKVRQAQPTPVPSPAAGGDARAQNSAQKVPSDFRTMLCLKHGCELLATFLTRGDNHALRPNAPQLKQQPEHSVCIGLGLRHTPLACDSACHTHTHLPQTTDRKHRTGQPSLPAPAGATCKHCVMGHQGQSLGHSTLHGHFESKQRHLHGHFEHIAWQQCGVEERRKGWQLLLRRLPIAARRFGAPGAANLVRSQQQKS